MEYITPLQLGVWKYGTRSKAGSVNIRLNSILSGEADELTVIKVREEGLRVPSPTASAMPGKEAKAIKSALYGVKDLDVDNNRAGRIVRGRVRWGAYNFPIALRARGMGRVSDADQVFRARHKPPDVHGCFSPKDGLLL